MKTFAFQTSRSRTAEPAAESEDRLPLILCFLLPVAIMIGVFAGKGVYPFGENSFLRTDLYHQYAPFFAEFARTLKSGGSLTYTTQIGLGTNFVALFAYYLSSPFNWLLIFIPSGAIIEFMSYLVVFKIGLCGYTMGYYLKARFHRNDIALPVIAIFYALSGYMAAYSWNIMWLDDLWLAPLVLLGIDRLVRKNQPFLYCITLALTILCNYYIAIMVCIFAVLYFICEMLLLQGKEQKEYLRRIVSFIVFSLIAGGISAILLLPAYYCLATTASADSTFPDTLISYFSALEMIARHMVDVETEVGLDHWPNIYSGVICFLLFPCYIINPRINTREKIIKTVLLAFMLLSFSTNVLNYIWHGMHYPNSLPCRQSFLYTIVLLSMCYEGLRKIRELTPRQFAAVFWGDIIFILMLQIALPDEQHEDYVYFLTILFIAIYALFLWLIETGHMHASSAMAVILAVAVVESGMNTAVTSVPTTNRTEYWSGTRSNQRLLESVAQTDTSGFYRVEKVSRRTKNDGAWTGYSSASLFSSTTQASVSDFYKMFGLEGNTNAFSFTGATPLMASFLDVKYMLSGTPLTESDLISYVGEDDGSYLYQNNCTLPLGFMINEETAGSFTYIDFTDPASQQNELVNVSAGTPDVLVQKANSYGQDEFDFTADETGHYYVYISNRDITDITAVVGTQTLTFSNVDRGYLLDLGEVAMGTEVSITSDDDMGYDVDATAYLFDDQAFVQWYQVMSRQGMQVTSFTNNLQKTEITGTVTAQTDGALLITIPCDSGWTIQVDGEEVTADTFANTFIQISLSAGTHEITMRYHVPGLIEGFMLTISSAIVLAMLYGWFLIQKKREEAKADRYRRARRAATYAALHEPPAGPDRGRTEDLPKNGGTGPDDGGTGPGGGENGTGGGENGAVDDLDSSIFDTISREEDSFTEAARRKAGSSRGRQDGHGRGLDATQPLPDMSAIRRAARGEDTKESEGIAEDLGYTETIPERGGLSGAEEDDFGFRETKPVPAESGESSRKKPEDEPAADDASCAPTGKPLSDDDIAEMLLGGRDSESRK